MSLATLREGMFHGIADEFVQEQGEGDGLRTRQHDILDIELQPHLPAREQVENVRREFRYESDKVESAAIRRIRHQALDGRERADSLCQIVESLSGVRVRHAAGRQQHQRGNDLEVVLDPVVALSQQQGGPIQCGPKLLLGPSPVAQVEARGQDVARWARAVRDPAEGQAAPDRLARLSAQRDVSLAPLLVPQHPLDHRDIVRDEPEEVQERATGNPCSEPPAQAEEGLVGDDDRKAGPACVEQQHSDPTGFEG